MTAESGTVSPELCQEEEYEDEEKDEDEDEDEEEEEEEEEAGDSVESSTFR